MKATFSSPTSATPVFLLTAIPLTPASFPLAMSNVCLINSSTLENGDAILIFTCSANFSIKLLGALQLTVLKGTNAYFRYLRGWLRFNTAIGWAFSRSNSSFKVKKAANSLKILGEDSWKLITWCYQFLVGVTRQGNIQFAAYPITQSAIKVKDSVQSETNPLKYKQWTSM